MANTICLAVLCKLQPTAYCREIVSEKKLAGRMVACPRVQGEGSVLPLAPSAITAETFGTNTSSPALALASWLGARHQTVPQVEKKNSLILEDIDIARYRTSDAAAGRAWGRYAAAIGLQQPLPFIPGIGSGFTVAFVSQINDKKHIPPAQHCHWLMFNC